MREFTPPEGTNFHCSGLLPVTDLSAALCKLVSYLQSADPRASLRQYDDWWEHDGLHFFKRNVGFHGVFEVVGTPRYLLEAMPGDDYVRVGVAPDSGKWYLRFFVTWDDSGSRLEGDFDITVPEEMESAFREQVLPELGLELEEENAASYYRRIRA